MAKIERFEDFDIWQQGRIITKKVYAACREGEFPRDFGLRDQIQRAAVSIMSNIAEGFERGTNKEFIQFLYIAKGSAGEVRSQLYVSLDLGYEDFPLFDPHCRFTDDNVFKRMLGVRSCIATFSPISYIDGGA